jgi:hypothetical protein
LDTSSCSCGASVCQRTLQRQLAGGLLQLGAGAVQGQLGEAPGQGLGAVEQAGQALDRGLVVGMG